MRKNQNKIAELLALIGIIIINPILILIFIVLTIIAYLEISWNKIMIVAGIAFIVAVFLIVLSSNETAAGIFGGMFLLSCIFYSIYESFFKNNDGFFENLKTFLLVMSGFIAFCLAASEGYGGIFILVFIIIFIIWGCIKNSLESKKENRYSQKNKK